MEEDKRREEGWLDRSEDSDWVREFRLRGRNITCRVVEGRTTVRDPRVEHPEGTMEFRKRVFKDNSSAEGIQESCIREHSRRSKRLKRMDHAQNNRIPREQPTSSRAS